ncbi:MAG: hypothetical protein JWR47_3048 [Phenylobacterium sp.]|nr:hypothetical protein [Phenylobacterium sp.]
MSDVLFLLVRVNLAGAAAIAVVMALRLTARRLFGAGAAYALWSFAPLAVLAMILPARVVVLAPPPAAGNAAMVPGAALAGAPPLLQPGLDLPPLLVGLWIAGAAASLLYLTWQQIRFSRAVRAGRAGPAVIGVLRPRIVTPDDFARRYTPCEQTVVLAHERTHIARHDSRINALVALVRCASWFNPFVHLLSYYLRIDQELACDAAVVAAHPKARRTYAEALLKTQIAARPLPLGCYWPAQAEHPLAQRISLLSRKTPAWAARGVGPAAIALLTVGGAWSAWAARPPQVVMAPAPAERRVALVEPTAIASISGPAAIASDAPGSLRRAASPSRAAMKQPGAPQSAPAPVLQPATDEASAPGPPRRLMTPGFFGPSRKIHAVADWSAVEPGSAVRVLATMTDPEGIPLTTDLTAFGSQSWYRLGYFRRNASRYKLFTSVVQHGDRLLVTAGLNRSFKSLVSGSVELASGETGTIKLPTGQVVTVTPTLRPETPEELAEGRRTGDRRFVNVDRVDNL